MKFLCDRCKTRYSIGDDRVRGKILKIRCKSCANVITVREGMTVDPDVSSAIPDHPGRAKKTTTIAPAAHDERGEAAKDRGGAGGPATEPLGTAKQPPGANEAGAARQLPGVTRQPLAAAKPAPGPATEPLGAARQPLGAAKSKLGPATEPLGPARGSASATRDPAGAVKGPAGAAKDRAGAAKGPAAAAVQPGAANDQPAASSAAQARRTAQPEDPARGQGAAAKRPQAQEFLRGEPDNALGAAFASAMAKPPPALEEEWYVSIDGDQSGPFSLADAQGWVARQAFDAELHCWSEGFDDWLPVDKVSHFRGLRKRPVPASSAAPPPVPRVPSVTQRAAAPVPAPAPAPVEPEDEPRPLFAATMASLERGAPAASSPGLQLPVPRSSARTLPAFGTATPPRTNGAAVAPGATRAIEDGKPGGARPGVSSGPVFGKMIDDPFELNDELGLGELADSETQIEQPPFSDEPGAVSATAGPVVRAGPSAAMRSAAPPSGASDFGDYDGELAIGEVSRVVKLADIARPPRNTEPSPGRRPGADPVPIRRSSVPVTRNTGAGMRMTGQRSRLRSAEAFPGAAPAEGDPGEVMAPVAKSHRRGLIALLGVAIVVVVGVGGAVFLFATNDDGPTEGSFGPVHDIDTSRPEDPSAHRSSNSVGSAGPASPASDPFVPRTPRPRQPAGPVVPNHDAELAPGVDSLRGEEIEDVARRNQDMTQRCYMRSQRGADSIIVGDVKKIAVTLTIDKDGRVNDVQLSDHGADNLGKCLSGSIKSWRFRQSAGGTFRFSLNFVSG